MRPAAWADLAVVEVDSAHRRFWSSLQPAIRAGMTESYLESESAYLRFLDSIVEMIADEAASRTAQGTHE